MGRCRNPLPRLTELRTKPQKLVEKLNLKSSSVRANAAQVHTSSATAYKQHNLC